MIVISTDPWIMWWFKHSNEFKFVVIKDAKKWRDQGAQVEFLRH